MRTQTDSLSFPAALARFDKPRMHAAYIVKLADEMIREIAELQADISTGALEIDGFTVNAQDHLRAVLQDLARYAAEGQRELGEAQDLLRSFDGATRVRSQSGE